MPTFNSKYDIGEVLYLMEEVCNWMPRRKEPKPHTVKAIHFVRVHNKILSLYELDSGIRREEEMLIDFIPT